MIYGLAARTNSKILDVVQADDESARDHAIDVLTTRFTLRGLAIDRILRLPDGSIATLTRADVEAMVAATAAQPRTPSPRRRQPQRTMLYVAPLERLLCLLDRFTGSGQGPSDLKHVIHHLP
jgi:hypothetical protein